MYLRIELGQVMNRDYGGLDALGSKHVASWPRPPVTRLSGEWSESRVACGLGKVVTFMGKKLIFNEEGKGLPHQKCDMNFLCSGFRFGIWDCWESGLGVDIWGGQNHVFFGRFIGLALETPKPGGEDEDEFLNLCFLGVIVPDSVVGCSWGWRAFYLLYFFGRIPCWSQFLLSSGSPKMDGETLHIFTLNVDLT